ncbi:MAG: hypothetical protein JW904_13875 [Spirochaetales bacterium]|nr:hypothetical protein [Spirochaetales bacterium]
MKKNILIYIISLLILFLITGCGRTEENTSASVLEESAGSAVVSSGDTAGQANTLPCRIGVIHAYDFKIEDLADVARYHPVRALDDDMSTCWTGRSRDSKLLWIHIGFSIDPIKMDRILLRFE